MKDFDSDVIFFSGDVTADVESPPDELVLLALLDLAGDVLDDDFVVDGGLRLFFVGVLLFTFVGESF